MRNSSKMSKMLQYYADAQVGIESSSPKPYESSLSELTSRMKSSMASSILTSPSPSESEL